MTQKPNRKVRSASVGPPIPRPPRTFISRRRWAFGALVLGGGLLGSAIFNRAATRRAEAATPPVGKFVEVDGVKLHYVDRGEGQPVVLLHGNGVLLQDFEVSGVLGLVAQKHRVIAFDRPGFGYSDRPRSTVWTPDAQAALIASAMAQLGIGEAIIVGHSWGSLVALALAVEHPEAVAGLVLMSGYYYGTARPDVVTMSAPAVPLAGDILAQTISPLAGMVTGPVAVKAAFAPAEVSEKFADFPIAMTLRPSQIRATAADTVMMVPAAVSLSQRYSKLNVPMIVMAGDGDLIVHMAKHAERFTDEVSGSELRVMSNQGHLFHYALPEQVATAVDDLKARMRPASKRQADAALIFAMEDA